MFRILLNLNNSAYKAIWDFRSLRKISNYLRLKCRTYKTCERVLTFKPKETRDRSRPFWHLLIIIPFCPHFVCTNHTHSWRSYIILGLLSFLCFLFKIR
uniref:Uncharacterized protein n=1 Tax=Helianthus annuus TaxID=4232 RepID=A0A251U925_HELAN